MKRITGRNTVIEFFHYGDYLPWQIVIRILESATSSALTHDADTFIGDQPIKTQVAGLLLMLVPKEEMTWRMWTTALWGMRTATKDNQMFFEWSFFLTHAGRLAGIGFLGDEATGAKENSME